MRGTRQSLLFPLRWSRLFALLVLLLVGLSAGVRRADAAPLSEVQFEGLRLIEEGTVRLQLTSKPGSEYSEATVQEDIKKIYRMGYFDQVGVKTATEGGAVRVTFVVMEKPAIRNIFLQGNEEVNDETIKQKLNVTARRFLDRQKLAAGIKELKTYYQSIGYYDTVVTPKESQVGENQVDVTFHIVEGEKKVIHTIAFEGGRSFSADDLEDVIKTAPHSWWISWLTGRGTLKKEQLESDTKELTRFYMNSGYAEVRVAEPRIDSTPDGLKVTFVIDEGEKFTFGDVTASGTVLEEGTEKTLEGVKIKKGDTFSAETLRNDVFLISEKFTDIGYAFANVNPLTRMNREAKTVDVDFNVDQGAKVNINRINISGNSKTHDNVIRRSLEVEEQSLYSSGKIKKSQEYLQRLGYFDEVSLSPQATDRADEVDLGVSVKEAQTGSFSIGGGVSSGDGFIFSTQISERNFFGTGNSVTLDANNGSRREAYMLSFQNPRVNDTRWSFNTDAQSTNREYSTFDRNQQSAGFGGGYPLWFLGPEYLEDVRFYTEYEFARIKIDNVEEKAPFLIREQQGTTTVSSVTPKLVRNTIDNPLDPKKGSRQQLSVELAGLGGEEKFWLGQAANTLYYPLWESPIGTFVFSQRTRLGYGATYDNEDFPVIRRFFPGGINSVRGYKARKMGPKDENNEVYGGDKELIANFEVIFPLFQAMGLNGVVFYDAGDAFDDGDAIEVSKLRQAVGGGFRWRSPLAPIRIEFGFPLDKEEGDTGFVTNFTFGTPQ